MEHNQEKLRRIFSENLKYYMGLSGETKSSLAAVMQYPFSTVSDWVDGKKYPRMDKVQALADHYGVLKSALTEKQEWSAPIVESGPISDDRRYLIDAIQVMSDENVRKLRIIVEQVIGERGQ